MTKKGCVVSDVEEKLCSAHAAADCRELRKLTRLMHLLPSDSEVPLSVDEVCVCVSMNCRHSPAASQLSV